MKTLILYFALSITAITIAQTGINYKAVVKDGSGNVLANQEIDVEFTIIKNVGIVEVYKELHEDVMTDSNGIIILTIGSGTPSIGAYVLIDWGNDIYFLKTQIDIGSGLVDMGTTLFNEVPFAVAAKRISEAPDRTLKVAGTGQQKIQVNSTNGGIPSIELMRTGASVTDWRLSNAGTWLDLIKSEDDFATAETKFSFHKDGRLGINNDNPAEELHVTGTIRSTDLAGTGTRAVSANTQGNLVIDTSPKTQYLSLNPSIFSAFQPTGADAFITAGSISGGGIIDFTGHIGLPHGATITKVKVYFLDNSIGDITFSLFSKPNNSDSGLVVINSLISSGTSTSNRTMESPTLNTLVNNLTNSYGIRASSSDWSIFALKVTGVLITYTLP